MKIFISGAAGYVGSVLVEELLKRRYSVTAFDNLMYKQTSLLHHCHDPSFNFICGDVRNHDLLKELAANCDVILPLACIVGMPACLANPDLAIAVNYGHVKFLCDNFPDKIIVYPNTNSGYGSGQGTSYCTEESPLNPLSLYGKTKCDAEKSVLDVGGISLRLATVFGTSPRQRLDLLVNNFVYKAIDDGYIVLFEKDFKRNYIHVRDVVSAFLFMIDNYEKCKRNIFNVGLSSANLSKYELALKIKEHVPGFSIQVDDFSKDKDQRDYIVSNEKLESLGWEAKYTLDHGIAELKKSFKMLFHSQQKYTNL